MLAVLRCPEKPCRDALGVKRSPDGSNIHGGKGFRFSGEEKKKKGKDGVTASTRAYQTAALYATEGQRREKESLGASTGATWSLIQAVDFLSTSF
jgi:hypothetical protein